MNWEIKPLGNILTIERGGSPRPIQNYLTDSEDGINWIKISDASASDKYIYKTKEKITKEGLHKTRIVHENDFLLSNSMSFGRPYIMKTTGCIHDGWLVLRQESNTVFDNNFLYYLLSSPYIFNQFDLLAAGSTVRNLNISLVSSVKVPIPPLEEQQAIVAKLDQAFAAIVQAKANIEKNIANAKELFQSKLNQIFSKKGEGWEERKLNDLFIIRPPKKEAKEALNDEDEVTFLPMEDLEVLTKNVVPVKKKKLKEVAGSYTYFAENDVLLAKITPCFENGKLGIAKGLINRIGFGSSEYIVFRTKGKILSEYLFYFLSRDTFRNEGKRKMQGAVGHKRVSKEFIEEYLLSYPSIETQQQIVTQLDQLQEQTNLLITKYQQKLANLEELKKSILEKAFKGELV